MDLKIETQQSSNEKPSENEVPVTKFKEDNPVEKRLKWALELELIDKPKRTITNKISLCIFLILMSASVYLAIDLWLKTEYKDHIAHFFLIDLMLENFYLVIIPVVPVFITILIFRFTSPDLAKNIAGIKQFYEFMSRGCRSLMVSSIICVIIPFLVVFIILCAHWTLLYYILTDTQNELSQKVTTYELYGMYALLTIETWMFMYIPKHAVMVIAICHTEKFQMEKAKKKTCGLILNLKATWIVCAYHLGTANLASVLLPYYGFASMLCCTNENKVNDKALIIAAANGLSLNEASLSTEKLMEKYEKDMFKNVNLLMFVLILVNTVIASGAYAILVSLDPFLLIFEIIIAMDIAMEIFSFYSTVSYVSIFND